jgi:hypothetical protein
MLDNKIEVVTSFPGAESVDPSGYKMEDFTRDNQLVMTWFSQLQHRFNQWRAEQSSQPVDTVKIEPTGSRSFNASYTESDLECAIVSENFDDFLDFCRFLNANYGNGHTFIAIKTLAGLPLLIIKGAEGFVCSELSKLYPNKTLPQLEITFRHPGVHALIQKAGVDFFAGLSAAELESYVFNKRLIELTARHASKDVLFEGEPLKKTLEAFKGILSAALKCLPAGKLQDTPDFNKDVFAAAVKPKPVLSEAVAAGIAFHRPASPKGDQLPPEVEPTIKLA